MNIQKWQSQDLMVNLPDDGILSIEESQISGILTRLHVKFKNGYVLSIVKIYRMEDGVYETAVLLKDEIIQGPEYHTREEIFQLVGDIAAA